MALGKQQCPYGRIMLPRMAATSIFVPRGSLICLLPLWEALYDQVGLTQAPLKLLPLIWFLDCWKLCMHPLRMKSLSYSPPTCLCASPLAFKVRSSGGSPSQCSLPPWAREPDVGLSPFTPWREPLQILPFVGHPPGDVGLNYTMSLPPYSSLCL